MKKLIIVLCVFAVLIIAIICIVLNLKGDKDNYSSSTITTTENLSSTSFIENNTTEITSNIIDTNITQPTTTSYVVKSNSTSTKSSNTEITTTITSIANTIPPSFDNTIKLPTNVGVIIYNYSDYNINKWPNKGLLIGNITDDKIYASANGDVVYTSNSSCNGKIIRINYKNINGIEYTVWYSGLKNINVKVGDKVGNTTEIATGLIDFKDATCSYGKGLVIIAYKGYYPKSGYGGTKEPIDPNIIVSFPNDWNNR